jgi:hypothetical protein
MQQRKMSRPPLTRNRQIPALNYSLNVGRYLYNPNSTVCTIIIATWYATTGSCSATLLYDL